MQRIQRVWTWGGDVDGVGSGVGGQHEQRVCIHEYLFRLI